MEPVFMILGQSAATAASLAIDAKVPVQKIDYARLHAQLLTDAQVLDWTPAPATASQSAPAAAPPALDGIVADDRDGKRTGEWVEGTRGGTQKIGPGYVHDENEKKGELSIEWTVNTSAPGEYEVVLHFPPNENRATNVPVTVDVGFGPQKFTVNEKESAGRATLGQYMLKKDAKVTITLSNKDTNGYVVADGVQLLLK
jgi:hypothetical protein